MLSEQQLDRPLNGRFRVEHAIYGGLLLTACILRMVWLGARPLHHDESIHAYYSWRILTVGPSDYRYDPVYHGPALYYLTAVLQWLLGPSDFSARMLSVLCGIGLVALAWPLRTLIGRREALFYALLIAVSPTFGYYSRSLRHDVPIAFFTLAALIAFLHFLHSRRRWHAYVAGISIGLAAATKEDIYLTAFAFANALWLVGLWKPAATERSLRARLAGWATEISEFVQRSWIPTATAIVLALTIAVILYTSLLTHPENWNATARALRYWWGQHSMQRIGGPRWYYLPLEVGYEGLIFLPALVMFATWIWRGPETRTQALLLAWTALSFALYAWAQEKVPWLLVPFLLPQALLAAHFFARRTTSELLRWSPLALFGLWSLVSSNYLYDAPRTTEPPESAHFEPLVYVQSTYDIPQILSEIEEVSKVVGSREKTNMVVVGDATWPLSWYLRDYPVHWSALPAETRAPILIVDPGDATRLEKDLGERYRSRRFAVRGWWQIEWQKMTPGNVLRFLLYRRVWNPTGTTDAVMLVAKDVQPGGELPLARLRPASPTRDYFATPAKPGDARVVGGPGTAPGQFSEPRGLAFDRDGSLLVADSKNNRIQKLDRSGKVITVFGGPSPGDGPGQFRAPGGVAAAPDGSIYVADTWNHRIQKLDREGRFILEWREQDPGFWGPRAVAVSPNGSIFVADTGNKRILAYDPGGQRLNVFGGDGNSPGQFVEPVGLAIDPETKVLYVADTGNHRVQSFDLEGRFRAAFTVFGWQEFYTEPYLAWHAGTLWATDSFNRRVNAY
ncbi:MAG: flippase activity-associated protein Agl23, partial [Candidatus Binatia bacterium]